VFSREEKADTYDRLEITANLPGKPQATQSAISLSSYRQNRNSQPPITRSALPCLESEDGLTPCILLAG
jgi:hypothetical protein